MILMGSLKMQSWFGRTHLPTVSPTDNAEGFFLVLVPVTADKTEKVIWSCYLAQEGKKA